MALTTKSFKPEPDRATLLEQRQAIDAQLHESDEERRLARRAELAEQLKGCSLADDGPIPGLVAAVKAAQNALEEARRNLRIAEAQRLGIAVGNNTRAAGITHELHATCSSQIADAIGRLERASDRARGQQKQLAGGYSNTPAIEKFTTAARAGIVELQDLRLAPLDEPALTKKIDAIFKRLPAEKFPPQKVLTETEAIGQEVE